MKILILSDTHIGCNRYSIVDQKTGLPSRLLDYQKTLNQSIDIAVEEKVDLVIHAGDLYHRNRPTPIEEVVTLRALKRLDEEGIPTHIIVGNHDYNATAGRESALGVLKNISFSHLNVYDQPHTHKQHDVEIIFFPHCEVDAEEHFSKFRKSKSKRILVCHTHISGSKTGAEEFLLAGGVRQLPANLKVDLVIAGHIHKPQEYKTNGYQVIVPGSTEKCDFAERKEQKSVVLLDTDNMSFKRKKLSTRNLIQYDFNDPNEIDFSSVEDGIVKVNIKCKESERHLIDHQGIKDSLSKAHFIAGINLRVEIDRVKNAKITEEVSPLQAFQQYLKEGEYGSLSKELREKGRELIESIS